MERNERDRQIEVLTKRAAQVVRMQQELADSPEPQNQPDEP